MKTMKSRMLSLYAMTLLLLGLLFASPVTPGWAQDAANDPAAAQESAYQDADDDGFDWGWIGLLGLVGLAGLMRRDRDPREANLGARPRP